MPEAQPDRDYIERAVAYANTNALRVALYQVTRDPEVRAVPARRVMAAGSESVQIDDDGVALIRRKAVEYLLEHAGEAAPEEVPDKELDELVQMAEAREIPPFELDMRRLLPSFGRVPHRARWSKDDLTPAGFSVAIVGGGFAGLAMAMQLEQLGVPYRLFERRAEVGGVWSINRYPDARVDTLSAIYQFGFEKKYAWTEHFARQSEVRGYLDHVAHEHGIEDKIRFGHDVRDAWYDENADEWHLSIEVDGKRTVEHTAQVVVTASGLFATPKALDIPGIETFGGRVLHTTEWDESIEYQGRRVAVIGNGSTGVQILARLADDAESVAVCQRTPQWIMPRPGYGAPIEDELRWLIDAMPCYWNWDKFVAGMSSTDLYEQLLVDHEWIRAGGQVSERNDALRAVLEGYIAQQVGGREDLIGRLIPDYPPMTRRPVVDNDWYASLTRENVELVTEGIESIDETGLRFADGSHREVDLIVTAVGFQAQKYLWPTRYRGRGGRTLEEAWAEEGAKAYLGMTVPDFPNLFMLYGPNSQPVASGTGLPCWFEIWTRYIGEALVMMLEGGHSAMSVRPEVFEKYNSLIDDEARRLVYLLDDSAFKKNYYVNDWGRLQSLAPFTGEHLFSMSANVDPDDFEFTGAPRSG
ncbi:flavin-containing monooxygenase [Tomitella fengzijianii]|nr:NAD(P)/FAD-dependent oxidoreductase [Tomitella fengzijianii]